MLCKDLLDDDIADDVQLALHMFSSPKLEGWGKNEARCEQYKVKVDECLKDEKEAIEFHFKEEKPLTHPPHYQRDHSQRCQR